VTLEDYPLQRSKAQGIKSTPFYSKKKKLSFVKFNIIIQMIINSSFKNKKKVGSVI
jgi:hypothetical protein